MRLRTVQRKCRWRRRQTRRSAECAANARALQASPRRVPSAPLGELTDARLGRLPFRRARRRTWGRFGAVSRTAAYEISLASPYSPRISQNVDISHRLSALRSRNTRSAVYVRQRGAARHQPASLGRARLFNHRHGAGAGLRDGLPSTCSGPLACR